MAPEPGYAHFSEPYLLDEVYIDGAFTPQWPGMSAEPSPGLWAIPTAGRTHKLQRQYQGDDKPKMYHCLKWSVPVAALAQTTWEAFKRAWSRGGAFYFATGIRYPDLFPAVSGQSYKLSRPLALGIVPGVTELDFPTIVRLDGVVTPSAATVVGQAVTANATGEIEVYYTPVHRVIFTAFPETINEHNLATATLAFEEVLA